MVVVWVPYLSHKLKSIKIETSMIEILLKTDAWCLIQTWRQPTRRITSHEFGREEAQGPKDSIGAQQGRLKEPRHPMVDARSTEID
jgi:hypothetical protein